MAAVVIAVMQERRWPGCAFSLAAEEAGVGATYWTDPSTPEQQEPVRRALAAAPGTLPLLVPTEQMLEVDGLRDDGTAGPVAREVHVPCRGTVEVNCAKWRRLRGQLRAWHHTQSPIHPNCITANCPHVRRCQKLPLSCGAWGVRVRVAGLQSVRPERRKL